MVFVTVNLSGYLTRDSVRSNCMGAAGTWMDGISGAPVRYAALSFGFRGTYRITVSWAESVFCGLRPTESPSDVSRLG